jgi:MoaA/NifB/PqqE/SkfB family radical SAM enzyme
MAREGRKFRVVQIHPSLRCNLACRYCYSLSSPLRKQVLPLETVLRLIDDLPGLGFDAVSVSGGEPLIWPSLGHALAAAREAGLVTALTTNLMPLTSERLAILRVHLNFCAVSLDGIPASHDIIRGRRGAFSIMQSRLGDLRAAGIPFGFIFTLTETNLDELGWVARFAVEQGANLLQVQPLEEAGRAAWEMAGARPRDQITNAAYLACLRLQQALGDRLPVQLDVAHRGALSREPWQAYGGVADTDSALPLADIIDTLVIEADGTVSPVQHGFDRATHWATCLRRRSRYSRRDGARAAVLPGCAPDARRRWQRLWPSRTTCPLSTGTKRSPPPDREPAFHYERYYPYHYHGRALLRLSRNVACQAWV